ncbi:MAG: MATE family efflux transporter [Bacteroidaceae bacterium]|nr:MATE family efflux transporter [Bacteroidaceae bacterium]
MKTSGRTKAVFLLAYPIVIAQLGTIIQGWADTIMVGQYGTSELSAASFVNNIFNLSLYCLLGISYATTPIAGALCSQGKFCRLLRVFRESNVVNLLASIIVVLLLLVLYCNIDHLGQPIELLPLIRPYFIALLISLPFLSLFNSMKQFFDALGDTKTPMWTMVGSNILNIILNYFLIFVLDLGLLGAGIATLAARMSMPLLMYLAIVRGSLQKIFDFQQIKTHSQSLKLTWRGMASLLRLGIPISVQLSLETCAFSISAIFMGWIGVTALAAHQVMVTISTLAFMVYYGIGAAAAIRMAHYRGINNWDEVRKTAAAAFKMSLAFGVIIVFVIYCAATPIARLFTSSQEVANLLLTFMPAFLCYQIGDCLQITYANALRSVENVRPMMLFAFISFVLIGIPLAYFLAFTLGMGALGIWWSYPFCLTVAGLSYYLQFKKTVKTRMAHSIK